MGNRENDFPSYLANEFSALKPPEKLTVSEWADRFRVLSERILRLLAHGGRRKHRIFGM